MTPLDRITAVLCAIGVALAGASLSLSSRLDQHPAPVRHAAAHHHHVPPPQPVALPFTVDPLAAAAAVACAAALAMWCWWQRRHRCHSCGYCPVWCRCDELPDSAPR